MKTSTPGRRKSDEFDLLWSLLPHPPGSVVRLFSRQGNVRDGDFAESAREIRTFARAHRTANVYVAPNPTAHRGGKRHAAADVTHWSYFLIDVDPIKPKADPETALGQYLLWLGEWMGRDFSRSQPIIIDSGRGVQAWIRLEDVPCNDEALPANVPGSVSRAVARRVNSYWMKQLDKKLGEVAGCRIDTSVSDLPRVMRCPGTVNVKTGRTARIITPSTHVHKGLASLLTNGTPVTEMTDPEPPPGIERGQRWQQVFPHLTLTAQTYLTQGQSEPGRHKVMWHTAKKLHELGVSREEARRALKWANGRRGADEELPADQVKHALDTAYGSSQA